MCGICVAWTSISSSDNKSTIEGALAALKPRGPDATQTCFLNHTNTNTQIAVGFTRLRIQGTIEGAEQPFCLSDGSVVVCNGEIFNSETLVATLGLQVPKGSSDCAVIPAMLERGMPLAEVARQLDGDFAIVYVDLSAGQVQACRDPYGVRPLFFNGTAFASELKGLPAIGSISAVGPGTVLTVDLASGVTTTAVWHQPPWLKHPGPIYSQKAALCQALEEAVHKRMATVREVGACLSGGLDSSLVAAIAARTLKQQGKRLHTYSIGMEGSPDLRAARIVADHIDSIHHEHVVTSDECLSIIPEVVRVIESFDVTTVRASVGNYLVGLLVAAKTPAVKVVLNGDGADEILGGYLYMRAAPDDAAFETETTRLLTEIHRYDVLRSERSMAAHGLESRSPFLDRQFVSVARSLPTALLRPSASTSASAEDRIEKVVLREAFAGTGLLPDEILWRRKEAFSDGISRAENSWFELAKAAGEIAVEGDWISNAAATYRVNQPKTAEAFWYRTLFHQWYPLEAAEAATPAMWMPRFVKGATDPSARTLSLYSTK
jgi:asparagine synthase (glutamine-hydrolysing)